MSLHLFGLQRYDYFFKAESFRPIFIEKISSHCIINVKIVYFCTQKNAETMFKFKIEQWYEANGRDLPWRHTSDPYLIMLSEFILQQTQVAQGTDYYLRFAERFPTAMHLAEASEEEVLRLWQGLGYYSRARHLHAAAQQIARTGGFPRDYSFVRALPGIGDYTAAAIMSLAFGEPYAVLDGNVQRVLSRHFGISEPVDSTQGKKLLRALADELLDKEHPALYNQAIMDFGALQCKPATPLCQTCPLAETCEALRTHQVDKLPIKSKRTAVRDRYLTYLYMRTKEGQTLLHRRGSGDIWQGLYEFPLIESEKPLTTEEVEKRLSPNLDVNSSELTLVARDVRHQLTHQRLHADLYILTLPQAIGEMQPATESSMVNTQWSTFNGRWVNESDLDRYAMPRLLLKLLEAIRRRD